MTSDAIAPAEVVVKVPKPSQFEDLTFQEMIPTPHVFLEESSYYLLAWQSSAYTFGNTTNTLVRLRYSSYFNYWKLALYLAPPLLGILGGFILTRLWDYRVGVKTIISSLGKRLFKHSHKDEQK